MHTLISSHPERNNDSSNATTVRRTQRQFAEVKPTTSRSPGAPERSNDNYIPIARCSRTQHHLPRWRQQRFDRQVPTNATSVRRGNDNYILIARCSRTQLRFAEATTTTSRSTGALERNDNDISTARCSWTKHQFAKSTPRTFSLEDDATSPGSSPADAGTSRYPDRLPLPFTICI